MATITQCEFCQLDLPPNAKFCMECGQKVALLESKEVAQARTSLPSGSSNGKKQRKLSRLRPASTRKRSQDRPADPTSHEGPKVSNQDISAESQHSGVHSKSEPATPPPAASRTSDSAAINNGKVIVVSADSSQSGRRAEGQSSDSDVVPLQMPANNTANLKSQPADVTPPSVAEADESDLNSFLGFEDTDVSSAAGEVQPAPTRSGKPSPRSGQQELPTATQPQATGRPSQQEVPLETATKSGVTDDTSAEIDLMQMLEDSGSQILPAPGLADLDFTILDDAGHEVGSVYAPESHDTSIRTPRTENAFSESRSQQPTQPKVTQPTPVSPQLKAPHTQLPQSGTPAVSVNSAAPQPFQVPMPQYIPVPMAMPMPSVSPEQNPSVETKKKDSPQPKLPNPEQTGADIPVVETSNAQQPSTPETDSQQAVKSSTIDSSDDSKGKAATTHRQKHASAMRQVRRLAEEAQKELMKDQEPIPQKLPRILAKHIAKLENLTAEKPDIIIPQLRVIAKTGSPQAIETFRDYAERRQPAIRQACAECLSGIDHPSSSITLLNLLKDPAPEVVEEAARSLVRLAHPKTVPTLLALGIADARSLVTIRETLTSLDEDDREVFVEPLQEAIEHHDSHDAAALALNLLSGIKGKELFKRYVSLASHESPEVRCAALQALVQTKEKQAVRLLNAAMKDSDSRVRSTAATALSQLSSPKSSALLIAALRDPNPVVRRSAAKTLTGFDGKEVAAAASKAINAETDPGVIEYLLEIVGKGGTDDALGKLQTYLESPETELRHRAITTLRRLKNPKGAKMLAPFLDDADEKTRCLAVEAVGHLNNSAALPKLRELLQEDRSEAVRAAAARALGDLQDAESLNILEEALHDGRMIRCQAVIAMGQIGQKSAIPALLAQLKDGAPEVRYHACVALGELGELPNPEPLWHMLDDSEAMVRRGAEAALNKLGCSFKKARMVGRLKKLATSLIPGTVAGALPGGTAVLVACAIAAVGAAIYFTMDNVTLSSEPDFPISDVRAIAVSQDGSQLSVARKFNVLEVWDLKSGAMSVQFKSGVGGSGIVYQPDGNAIILAGAQSFVLNTSTVAEVETDALQPGTLKNTETHRIARTPDGSKAVLCGETGKAVVVDLQAGKQLLTFQIKDFESTDSIAISPDASMAFVGTRSGFLKAVGLADGKAIGRINLAQVMNSPKAAITELAVNAAGTHIAVGTSQGKVVVLDANELKVVGEPFADDGAIVGLTFIGETNELSVVTNRRKLARCSQDFTNAATLETALPSIPERISFSADGQVGAFAFSESSNFCVIDLATDKMLATYPLPGSAK